MLNFTGDEFKNPVLIVKLDPAQLERTNLLILSPGRFETVKLDPAQIFRFCLLVISRSSCEIAEMPIHHTSK